ncbi:hypothetical protein [Bradyrhizobium sp. NC92]|uniref:hypothetical protein n=1 Tax=Bradyrhizobium sp. (strain NC92) TaxID=55395 RepID=UPI0021A9B935|nr:hypothetical protein [Bradyrhizobium sp. NC92]UWU68216.1 hypothetical protein N2602_34835 [Bradyrhizobium sp. NC92]
MKPIEELFNLHRAKSGLYSEYDSGEVPYIGNGFPDNGVTGFVTPLPDDKVFQFTGIAVSAFCEATVQAAPFVACGRAGNGLSVLEPKSPMPLEQLAYIASYINTDLRWRFNWYRQTTVDRLRHLKVPDEMPANLSFDVKAALPKRTDVKREKWKLNLKMFRLGDFYDLEPGHFHSVGELPPGKVPIVSCGHSDNGVVGYFDVGDAPTYADRITIAFNGKNTLTAKYHPYKFAAKDDVAVCHPKGPLLPTTEMFIQTMVNRERWRYSYYRKCYSDKLRRFQIGIPAKGGMIDEETIRAVVEASPYWAYIKTAVDPSAHQGAPTLG